MKTRITCLFVALCMILSCVAVGCFTATAANTAPAETSAGTSYGLPDKCEDGNILQCFNWKLSDIKSSLASIAAAGFTGVQTSPLQRHDGDSRWYWLYQPTGFTLGNEIGSLNDLKSLCTEADKYGIKVIVDVVANHLAGNKDGYWAGSIENDMRNSDYFHNQGACSNYDNRNDLIYKNIGMPDLNSENTYVQNKVVSYINTLKNAGVDGIRWDAAKHIGLPSENCQFWPKVTNNGLYHYGEILDAPAGKSSEAINNALIGEYDDYICVTDETYSGTITGSFRDKRLSKSKGNWNTRGVSANRIVYWGESHDTYSNGDGWTKNLDQNIIDRSYAVLGARADSQAMYLSRPNSSDYNSIYGGSKGSTHFTSKEVAAVNQFHNAMVGKAENFATSGGCYVICREGGAVIVSVSGSNVEVTVNNNGGLVPAGTYTDQVSGNKWTVTETEISGKIGSTGIVVIYGKAFVPAPTTKPTQAPTQAPTQPPTAKPTQPPTAKPTQPPTAKPTTPAPRIMIGDTDLDGEITIIDATRIQRKLASLTELSSAAEIAADADEDGEITILDATAIQRNLAGLSTNAARIGIYIGGITPTTVPTQAPTSAPTQPPTAKPTQPPTQAPTQPPTQAPTAAPTSVPSDVVVLNASATSTGDEAWYAWTWGSGEGRWVKGDGNASAVTYKGLDTNVVFVRSDPSRNIDWNNGSVWNKTEDLTTVYGGTYITSGWNDSIMNGSWAE